MKTLNPTDHLFTKLSLIREAELVVNSLLTRTQNKKVPKVTKTESIYLIQAQPRTHKKTKTLYNH